MDTLRSIFDRLNLILIGEAAIHFRDTETRRICLGIWDEDKDGYITVEEAGIEHLITASTFSKNTKITTFDEFKYLNYITSSNSLFYGCTALRSIELPEQIDIGYQFFMGCTSLERCIIGSACPAISKWAFCECIKLREISIPESVTTINSGAFQGAGISRFVYPSNVTKIDGFSDNPNLTHVEIRGESVISVTGMGSCPLLETLIIRATTPPTTDYWTLRDSNIPNIYVPDSAVDAYKTSSGWSKWASYIKPISELVEN